MNPYLMVQRVGRAIIFGAVVAHNEPHAEDQYFPNDPLGKFSVTTNVTTTTNSMPYHGMTIFCNKTN